MSGLGVQIQPFVLARTFAPTPSLGDISAIPDLWRQSRADAPFIPVGTSAYLSAHTGWLRDNASNFAKNAADVARGQGVDLCQLRMGQVDSLIGRMQGSRALDLLGDSVPFAMQDFCSFEAVASQALREIGRTLAPDVGKTVNAFLDKGATYVSSAVPSVGLAFTGPAAALGLSLLGAIANAFRKRRRQRRASSRARASARQAWDACLRVADATVVRGIEGRARAYACVRIAERIAVAVALSCGWARPDAGNLLGTVPQLAVSRPEERWPTFERWERTIYPSMAQLMTDVGAGAYQWGWGKGAPYAIERGGPNETQWAAHPAWSEIAGSAQDPAEFQSFRAGLWSPTLSAAEQSQARKSQAELASSASPQPFGAYGLGYALPPYGSRWAEATMEMRPTLEADYRTEDEYGVFAQACTGFARSILGFSASRTARAATVAGFVSFWMGGYPDASEDILGDLHSDVALTRVARNGVRVVMQDVQLRSLTRASAAPLFHTVNKGVQQVFGEAHPVSIPSIVRASVHSSQGAGYASPCFDSPGGKVRLTAAPIGEFDSRRRAVGLLLRSPSGSWRLGSVVRLDDGEVFLETTIPREDRRVLAFSFTQRQAFVSLLAEYGWVSNALSVAELPPMACLDNVASFSKAHETDFSVLAGNRARIMVGGQQRELVTSLPASLGAWLDSQGDAFWAEVWRASAGAGDGLFIGSAVAQVGFGAGALARSMGDDTKRGGGVALGALAAGAGLWWWARRRSSG